MREGRGGEDGGGFQDAPATAGRAGLLRENLAVQDKEIAEPNTDQKNKKDES